MNAVNLIQKHFVKIIAVIAVILIIVILFMLVKKGKSVASTVSSVVADNTETQLISDKTGLTNSRINELRGRARNLAFELQTLKGMSFLDKLTNAHFQSDDETLKHFKGITQVEEMQTFKAFYENVWTDKNTLYEDLDDTLSASNLNKVPFIYSLI